MRGCISDEFTLTRGRILGLRGPVEGERTMEASGLFVDALGLRTGNSTSGDVRHVTASTGANTELPVINAGARWQIPSPTITVDNPSTTDTYAVSGLWSLSWSTTVHPGRGALHLYAEPDRGPRERPPEISAWRPGAINQGNIWADSVVWPHTEIIPPGGRVTLHLNPSVFNNLSRPHQFTHYRVEYAGIAAPTTGQSLRELLIGEAIDQAAGSTIDELITNATATTVGAVIDEWSVIP